MSNKNFDEGLIGSDEYTDFSNSIKKCGLNENDFKIETKRTDHNNDGIYFIFGTVTITYKPTNKSRIYKAGHGSFWPHEFDNDLNKKYFS